MESSPKETHICLALEALKQDPKHSAKRAAKIFNVSRTTLRRCSQGTSLRRGSPMNSVKLTELKEKMIIKYILNLDSRSYPPRINAVDKIANYLL
jgi:hypothetical protein